jgi:hypothetical protein
MTIPLIELDLRLPMLGISFDHVLFLDIDGVLHPDGPGDYQDFSCLPLFCDALRAADAPGRVPIVISSAWRHTQRLTDIRSHFPADIGPRVVGVTPDLADPATTAIGSPAPIDRAATGTYRRQGEITAWIRRNAPKGQWLALDDRSSGFEQDCPNLFLVPGTSRDGGGPGITASVAADLGRRLEAFLHQR